MERSLVHIEKIIDIQPIPDADKIVVASVLGWKCVVGKDDFKIGDYCVYFEIDTVAPQKPEFEFLRKNNFRIKTIRLRKQLSQGLAFPINKLFPNGLDCKEGMDVTDQLGVVKYEVPIPAQLSGEVRGSRPGWIPYTDETNIQNCLGCIDEIKNIPCYISVKINGTSSSFGKLNDEYHVTSRNLSLKETDDNTFWKVSRKYNLKEKLPNGYVIQGELAGPSIQKNPLGLKEWELFVFNVIQITDRKHLDYNDLISFCKEYQLQTVPIEKDNFILGDEINLEKLIKMSEGKYPISHKNREGIVIRPMKFIYSETLCGRLSFKVLNNVHLEEEK